MLTAGFQFANEGAPKCVIGRGGRSATFLSRWVFLQSKTLTYLTQLLYSAAQPQKEVSTIENYTFSDVAVDFQKFKAIKDNQPIELSPREFELLKFLVNHRGETVTREQLLDAVWGYNAMMFTRTVDNHIAKLRQKIEDDPENPAFILTVHRVGYRFIG